MNLIDLITGKTGVQAATQVENKFDIGKNQIITLLVVATPLIISYLRKKSENTEEAEALDKALDKDHDGSILDQPELLENRRDEGSSILNHIFGSKKTEIEQQLSQNTGISMDKIGGVLAMLAPLIMGYIGREKQQSQANAGGLRELLGNILGGTQNTTGSPSLQDIFGQFLGGSSGTNNTLNDILGQVLGNDSKQKSGNDAIGGLLGGLFGGK